MPASVHLHVLNPDGSSRVFHLTEHDTFLLGRMTDCHLCLPDDSRVSRHSSQLTIRVINPIQFTIA